MESCVKWLIVSFNGGQQDDDNTQDQEKQMLLRLNALLVSVLEIQIKFLWERVC